MRAFFDIDTQIDFMYPAGALYGKGGEGLIAPVARLNHRAPAIGVPLISSICAHPENAGEFRVWPPHCVAGTLGQQKPPALLLARRKVIPNVKVEIDVAGVDQVLLEKNDLDLFTNPNLLPLLDRLSIDSCVVYGAFTDYCVRCAVDGLLRSGRQVSLVTDAIAALNPEEGASVMNHFVAAGGTLTTIAEVLATE